MNIKFFTLKTKSDFSAIHIRLYDAKRYDKKTSTGLTIQKQYFSNKQGKVKQKADFKQKDKINRTLNELKTFIADKYLTDSIANGIYDNWLKDNVNKFFNRTNEQTNKNVFYTAWIDDFIKTAPNRVYKGKVIKRRTIQGYVTTYKKLKEYEQHTDKRLKHQDINLNFYNDFVSFCITESKLNKNTTGGHIKNIKLFCRLIELEGLPIHQDFKHPEFLVLRNEAKDIYLTDDEINKIYKHDFSKSIRLQNAKDLFIIGLRTGLRISDFMSIKDINIKEGFIHIQTKKTGQNVIIPLHEQIKEIYKRRGGLPYTISHQKFNKYIKEICKIVGIDEQTEGAIFNPETKRKEAGIFPKYQLVTSHICRRSFATNLYLKAELPNRVIMDITGHKTETQFLKYIKVTKQQTAETLRKFWAKKEKEKGYTNALKVVNRNF